jgi:transposase-like protein
VKAGVKAFLGRPIEGERQNGRIVSVSVIVAVGVNSDGPA